MTFRMLVLLVLAWAAPSVRARLVLLYDMENRLPVGGVAVTVRSDSVTVIQRDTLDYRGRCLLPDTFHSVTFSKAGYYAETLYLREVTDTMWLVPEGMRLNEVVVDGHYRANTGKLKHDIPYLDPLHKAKHGVMGFDFANLLDRRGRRDRKHLRKAREITKAYDQAGILIPKKTKDGGGK